MGLTLEEMQAQVDAQKQRDRVRNAPGFSPKAKRSGFSHKGATPAFNDLQAVFESLQDFNFLALPSISYQFKGKLPSRPAVYIVYLDCDVLYVGQSVDVQTRWRNHDVEGKLATSEGLPANPNLRIGWLECSKHLLDFTEIYLIGLLQPVLNIKHRNY